MKKLFAVIIGAALLISILSSSAMAAEKTNTLYTTQAVNMYNQPNAQASVVQTIPASASVTSYNVYQNGFIDCAYQKIAGWIWSEFLSQTNGSGKSAVSKTAVKATDSTAWYSNRDWSDQYDYEYYKTNNPDVVAALGTDPAALIEHYVIFGIKEGRKGKQ